MTPDDRDKLVALAACGALLTAVMAPVRQHWRPTRRDGFPLSCYPMFTAKRHRHGTVTYLLGVQGDGVRRFLHYSYLGSGGLNQVRRQLRRAVHEGRAAEIASSAATALARSPRRGDRSVTQVLVVTGRYCYDDFFTGNREPVAETVHATAAVPGLAAVIATTAQPPGQAGSSGGSGP